MQHSRSLLKSVAIGSSISTLLEAICSQSWGAFLSLSSQILTSFLVSPPTSPQCLIVDWRTPTSDGSSPLTFLPLKWELAAFLRGSCASPWLDHRLSSAFSVTSRLQKDVMMYYGVLCKSNNTFSFTTIDHRKYIFIE